MSVLITYGAKLPTNLFLYSLTNIFQSGSPHRYGPCCPAISLSLPKDPRAPALGPIKALFPVYMQMPSMLLSVLAIIFVFALPLKCVAQRLSRNPNELRVEDASGRMVALFTVEQLRSDFEQQTYDTRTPWTGEHETVVFRGPLLETILEQAGVADADVVKVVAYDDFISEIHRDEILSYKPILAVQRKCSDTDKATSRCLLDQDFRPIKLVEKGPIFIVWPLDELPTSYVPARNSIWVFFPTILRATQ